MHRSRLVRFLLVPGLVAPAVAVSLAFAGPASAMATTCATLTGNATGSPASTVSGCNDTANTGGNGTFPVGALSSPSSVTWATGGTNTFTFTYKQYATGKKDKCLKVAAGDITIALKGKVTGSTGLGSSVKGKIKATICVDTIGDLSLYPATTFNF